MRILDESEIEKTFVERDPVLPDLPSSQPALPAARPLVGQTRIGFGLVVDTIGVGGMASVYKVWNERLELFRAVKMLSSDTLHARFETEAKITAKLRHPHIVEVYGIGEWNGVPYMEMEYVDGVNLQEALDAGGRFPDAVCCAVGLCVASALDYAHTLKFTLGGNSYDGIIHRDLKPANILVSKRSEIKLTDFGIARPAQAGLHTIDGNIVGTLHYLSPEQLENGKIDRRSDIYSFGTILYEMATGVKAFPQKSITELTMRRAANDFKSPDDFDTPVTPAISNIILKCLKAPAEERYRRVAELIGDLRKTYAEIAPDSAPQKTLYEFFTAKNTNDAGVTGITPTVLISVGAGTDNAADAGVNAVNATNMDTGGTVNATDDVVAASIDTNTNINTVDTAFNTRADTGIDTAKKSPTIRKTTACAAAISIMLLSALYLTAKIISHRQPKTDGKQSAATVKFFSAPVNTDTQSAAANVSPPVNTHTAAVNNASAPNTAGTASVDTVDIDTASINTAGVDTAVVDTTGINAANVNAGNANTNNINAGNIHTAKPAPVTESALIKNAAEAIAKKEWDRAVRLLEKNNAAFTEKRGERNLLLFEAYVESRQLEKARTVIDSAAQTNDALYFLTAGRYMFYRNDHANALAALETSLTRSSAMRDRNAIIGDALFYIAMIRSNRFKASPAEITRKQAQDAWRRVKSAYESRPESAQFKRAEAEILELY